MHKNLLNNQPGLFDFNAESAGLEEILLYALGEFQSRKKILADRELALDRLRGAFKRAAERFGVAEFSDEEIAGGLERLDAKVKRVQNFVAKHPFRVTIQNNLAEKAKQFYQESLKDD